MQVLKEQGASLEQNERPYLHATFTTRVMRFVDDVEFRMVLEQELIHVRSASRVGYSDLGTNRRRVERLRNAFDSAMSDE